MVASGQYGLYTFRSIANQLEDIVELALNRLHMESPYLPTQQLLRTWNEEGVRLCRR